MQETSRVILRTPFSLLPFCDFFQHTLGDIFGGVNLAKWLYKFTLWVHEVKVDAVVHEIIFPDYMETSGSPNFDRKGAVRDCSPSLGGGLEKYTR
jgi:hypothetical protein